MFDSVMCLFFCLKLSFRKSWTVETWDVVRFSRQGRVGKLDSGAGETPETEQVVVGSTAEAASCPFSVRLVAMMQT